MMDRFSRRSLLAGAALTLPWLERRAQAALDPPRRLVVVVVPNGFLRDRFVPRPVGTTEDLALSPTLEPLSAYRSNLVVIDGLSNDAAIASRGPALERGFGTLLTGTPLANGATAGFVSGGGISVDQAAAQADTTSMRQSALVLGVAVPSGNAVLASPSYTGSRQPVVPIGSPGEAHQAIFANAMPMNARAPGLERIAVTASQKNLAFLRRRFGGDDQRRLDAHTESLRLVSQQLDAVGQLCASMAAPSTDAQSPPLEVARAHARLVTAAFTCDRARVATIVWEGAGGNARIGEARQGHHDLAQQAANSRAARKELEAVELAIMGEIAFLLDSLARQPEGASNLLANTLVLVCSDVGAVTREPTFAPLPCLLAGGLVRGGRFLRPARASWNQLLVSVLHIVGRNNQRFGDPRFGAAPLPGL